MQKQFYSTMLDAIEKFNAHYPNKQNVISTVNRFLLPSFGLELSGTRMTKIEKENAKIIANSINISELSKDDILARVENAFEQQKVIKSKRKSPRSLINFFIIFLEGYKFIKIVNEKDTESQDIRRVRNKVPLTIDKSHIEKPKNKAKEPITLSFNYKDYLKNDETKTQNIEIKSIKKELNRIKKEFDIFNNFLKKTMRNVTAESHLQRIKRILGWMYLHQDFTLNELTFTAIIEVVNTRINVFDFKQVEQYFIAKGKAELESKKAAKYTKNILETFFENYNVDNRQTRILYIDSLVALAKYLYKDITDEDEADNYEDIAVVRILRVYRRKLPKEAKKINQLYFTWEEVLKVRDAFKKDADTTHFYSHRKATDKKSARIEKIKRSQQAIAESLEKFLILCFFTVIPPDRARTIRELRIGKSLKQGIKDGDTFIPFEKLNNPKLAKYYIHLNPEDYKTGDKYGEFWGELYNYSFDDGTKFYDYLDKWFHQGWRDILSERNKNYPKHDYVFMRPRTTAPLNKDGIYHIVEWIFRSKTGIGLGPHKLRHIFRTYIDEIGVSPTESASVASWMHHSEEVAKGVYTISELNKKLRPGFELMQKINKNHFD